MDRGVALSKKKLHREIPCQIPIPDVQLPIVGTLGPPKSPVPRSEADARFAGQGVIFITCGQQGIQAPHASLR